MITISIEGVRYFIWWEKCKSRDHTGLVGKWHCGDERLVQPGFDRWFSYWFRQYPHVGKQQFSDQGKLLEVDGRQTPLLAEQAVDFIEKHKRGGTQAPFFLVVGFVDTHSPYEGHPDDLVEHYRQATFRDIPDEQFSETHGKCNTPVLADPNKERERRAQYYAAVTHIDQHVGKIIEKLKATGQYDNTLIVYTSDHGLNAGHHGMWNKGNATLPQNFLEESILIPCLISWPAGDVTKSAASDAMVDLCDLHATLLDAAGVTADPTLQSPGRSFLPMLRGQSVADWKSIQFCEYGNARMGRTDRYKLILRYPFRNVARPHELYDLKTDPRERTNVYTDAARAEVVQQITSAVTKHFSRYTVPKHDGLKLEDQPVCTRFSPWLRMKPG